MGQPLLVYVTVPDESVASEIAEALVDDRLVACVNVVPTIRSFFRWEGQVQKEEEVLLLIKTTSAVFPRLRERIVGLHPYRVPCVTALPITDGHQPYLDWVREEVGANPS